MQVAPVVILLAEELLTEELVADEREDDVLEELTADEREEEVLDELTTLLLDDERLEEVAADDVPDTIPQGAGCPLQVEGATQLLPFS